MAGCIYTFGTRGQIDKVKYEESQLYSECKVRTELGYDLALSPDDDVASKNPGYEAVLGAINKINN